VTQSHPGERREVIRDLLDRRRLVPALREHRAPESMSWARRAAAVSRRPRSATGGRITTM
jgi:hypothetical protein